MGGARKAPLQSAQRAWYAPGACASSGNGSRRVAWGLAPHTATAPARHAPPGARTTAPHARKHALPTLPPTTKNADTHTNSYIHPLRAYAPGAANACLYLYIVKISAFLVTAGLKKLQFLQKKHLALKGGESAQGATQSSYCKEIALKKRTRLVLRFPVGVVVG